MYLLCIGSGPFGTLLLLTMNSPEFECRACLCMLTNFKCFEITFIGTSTVLLVWRFTEIARNINQMTPKDTKAPRSNFLQLMTPPTPISSPLFISLIFLPVQRCENASATLWHWSLKDNIRSIERERERERTKEKKRKREQQRRTIWFLTWRA